MMKEDRTKHSPNLTTEVDHLGQLHYLRGAGLKIHTGSGVKNLKIKKHLKHFERNN